MTYVDAVNKSYFQTVYAEYILRGRNHLLPLCEDNIVYPSEFVNTNLYFQFLHNPVFMKSIFPSKNYFMFTNIYSGIRSQTDWVWSSTDLSITGSLLGHLDLQVAGYGMGIVLSCIFFARQIKLMIRVIKGVNNWVVVNNASKYAAQTRLGIILLGNINCLFDGYKMADRSLILMFNRLSGCTLPIGAMSTAYGTKIVLLYIVNFIVSPRVCDPLFISTLNDYVINIITPFITTDIDALGTINPSNFN